MGAVAGGAVEPIAILVELLRYARVEEVGLEPEGIEIRPAGIAGGTNSVTDFLEEPNRFVDRIV